MLASGFSFSINHARGGSLQKHQHYSSTNMAMSENKARSLRGELYYAFTPELVAERRRCSHACSRFNNAGEITRRRQVELWNEWAISAMIQHDCLDSHSVVLLETRLPSPFQQKHQKPMKNSSLKTHGLNLRSTLTMEPTSSSARMSLSTSTVPFWILAW